MVGEPTGFMINMEMVGSVESKELIQFVDETILLLEESFSDKEKEQNLANAISVGFIQVLWERFWFLKDRCNLLHH